MPLVEEKKDGSGRSENEMSTNALYGHLTINSVDALAEYGFVILRGSMESWLQMPKMKPAFSHNWKDKHGIKVNLSHRYMKEKQVSLNMLFIVNNELDFSTQIGRASCRERV